MSPVDVSEQIKKKKKEDDITRRNGGLIIKISRGSFLRSQEEKEKTINEFLVRCLIYRYRANWTLVTILITSASYFV